MADSADKQLAFHRHGILFVVSAPSGAGKSTLLERLRPNQDFVYSVSCTTRKPRSGEIEGRDYFFLSREEFQHRIQSGDFIEWAEVHGNFYGTPRQTVLKNLEAGVDVLVDIDVQGADRIRNNDQSIRNVLADIFILPPSMAELHRRLLKRATETPEQVALRLANAKVEMEAWPAYKYTMISGAPEEDLRQFRAIMEAERHLSARLSL